MTPHADTYSTADRAWQALLEAVLINGYRHLVRGLETLEAPHLSVAFDMRHALVMNPKRKLNYRYAATQALWISSGSDKLEDLGEWAKLERPFSDDGSTLWGAYGPRWERQLPYIVASLNHDRGTRQAVATFWKQIFDQRATTIPPSKDVPCTVALCFNVRGDELNCHAFMRSSDLWLGWPYDMFTFTCLACQIIDQLTLKPQLGRLYFTAVSAHLYERDYLKAREVVHYHTALPVPDLTLDLVWQFDKLRAALRAQALTGEPYGQPVAKENL